MIFNYDMQTELIIVIEKVIEFVKQRTITCCNHFTMSQYWTILNLVHTSQLIVTRRGYGTLLGITVTVLGIWM